MQVEPFCGRLNHAGEILSESKDLGQENIRLSGGGCSQLLTRLATNSRLQGNLQGIWAVEWIELRPIAAKTLEKAVSGTKS